VKSIVYLNVASGHRVLQQCFDSIDVDRVPDLLFALFDIATFKQNSLAAVPPLNFPQYDENAEQMFKHLASVRACAPQSCVLFSIL